MPRHSPDLAGSYPFAEVIRRSTRCMTSECPAPAIYDVSLRNERGEAQDWLSFCATHTGRLIKDHHEKMPGQSRMETVDRTVETGRAAQ